MASLHSPLLLHSKTRRTGAPDHQMGQNKPPSTSGMKPNSGKWLTHQRAGLPFNGPGENGWQEPHEAQQGQMPSPACEKDRGAGDSSWAAKALGL